MRVWVTRTEPGGGRLAGALADAGHEPMLRPVLEIEPIQSDPPTGPFEVTVFLSEHAAENAIANGWVRTPALAIGASTRRALKRHNVDARTPDVATSEGIIERLRVEMPQSVLIAAGEGGRDVLEAWLVEHGVETAKWPLYRRLELEGTLEAGAAIEAIVVGSVAGLRVVAKMWFASRRDAAVPVLVPSERAAGAARDHGFTRVVISAGAGADAVVTALEEL